MRPTMIVRGASDADVDGMSKPTAAMPAVSRAEITNPIAMPTMDAKIPTMSASIATIQTTCPPVAPTARISASSRWRCRTMMRKVF